MKRLACLAAALFFGPAAAAELTLAQAVERALAHNPRVAAARAAVEAARARVDGASIALARNPELSAAGGPRARGMDVLADYEISLAQPLELGGQRSARMEGAAAEVRAAVARLAAQRAEVAAEVKQAFGRALGADVRARVRAEGAVLARDALEATQERHRAGDASQLEVNAARMEVGRTARERLAAEQRLVEAQAALRGLLDLGAGDALQLSGELERLAEARVDVPGAEALALGRRGELAAAKEEVRAARADVQLAEREAVPDLKVGTRYSREETAHIVQATVAIELPFFERNQGARGAAGVQVSARQAAHDALARQISLEMAVALARREAARAAAGALGAEVLQAAEANLELATLGHKEGQLDFLQLLLIRRETLQARCDHADALEEVVAAEAALERAVGSAPGGG